MTKIFQMDSSWTKILSTVGIPGFIAVYLIYSLTTTISNRMQEQAQRMEEMANSHNQMTTVLEGLNQRNQSQSRTNTQLQKLLQRICINTSSTNEERRQCVD